MADSLFHEEKTLIHSASADAETAETWSAPVPEPSLTGKIIASCYQIGEAIGEGSWSTVYRGWHLRLNQPVAIKCLHEHLVSLEHVRRFQFEAQTVGKLHHGNIVQVYDFGCFDDKQPYIVMALVDGPSLAKLLKVVSTISLERCAALSKQVAQALDYAHSHAIVHRDIKPENILLELVEQGKETAKIADFGIVKALTTEENQAELTQTGEVLGTPQYMSPEQCFGKVLDGRSDIYSLGCLMYECLTGHPPFEARTNFECMLNHLETTPQPLFPAETASVQQQIFQKIVLTCLAKDPLARPTAASLARMLGRFLNGNYSAVDREIKAISKKQKTWRPAVAVTLVSVCAVLALSALTATLMQPVLRLPQHLPAKTQPAPQQSDYLTGESPANDLKTAFSDIEYGITQLRDAGKPDQARQLQQQLDDYRTEFATGKGTFTTPSPLQIISIGRGDSTANSDSQGQASVVVTYQDAPIILLLRSLQSTRWNLTVKPGAKVAKIFLLSAPNKKQQVSGAPSGVPIASLAENGVVRSTPLPQGNELGQFYQEVKQQTGLSIGTYQGKRNSAPAAWVIGPESKDWRAQMILHRIGTLHAEAMKPVHDRILSWLAKTEPRVAWAGSGNTLCLGKVAAPRESFDFLPGIIADSWKLPPDCTCAVSAQPLKFSVPAYTQSKVIPSNQNLFAVFARGLLRLSSAAPVSELKPDKKIAFSASDYDFTLDSKRNRLLVKDAKSLLSVDPVSGLWNRLGEFHGRSADEKQGDMPAYIQGMSYCQDNDSIYFLNHGNATAEYAQTVTRFSTTGNLLEDLGLNYHVPMEHKGGDGFTQMYYSSPYLLAISSAPYESGKTLDPESLTLHEQDSRRYLWVIDSHTGRVLLVAPTTIKTLPLDLSPLGDQW